MNQIPLEDIGTSGKGTVDDQICKKKRFAMFCAGDFFFLEWSKPVEVCT